MEEYLNFSTSTSPATIQQVNQATPLLTLNSSLDPSDYGQIVTFTSTVSSPTSLGVPTGTVTFFNGVTAIGTSALTQIGTNTSSATLDVQNLSGGSNQITALYNSDTNFTSVTSSPPLAQSVILANTTTLIFSNSPNPSEFGQPVLLQANITGSVTSPPLSPSGEVIFYDGTNVIGTATVSMLSPNIAFATMTTSDLSIGSHTLTATYQGDINYNPSTSPSMTQTIIFTSTEITTTSVTPSLFGELVTFTSTVNSNVPGMGSPTGTVQFYNGIYLLGSSILSASGPDTSQATLQVSNLSLGSHMIETTYLGDGNFTSATAPLITQVVIQDPTTTILSSSLNPSNFGDNITLSASVTANSPGSGIPTGTVTFNDGATVLGTGIVDGSGVATFSTIALYPGTHVLTGVYSGDLNYITSTSAPFDQVVVNQLPTVTTIASFRNSSPINQAVTYSATITAITGTPTGSVTFFDNGVVFGTGTLNTNGVATVTEPAGMLSQLGLHPITASYGGDANFIASMSTTFSQYIVPYDTTTVLTIIPNHSEQANATFQATVTASGSPTPIPPFTGTITFYENGVAISPSLAVDPTTGTVSFQPNDLHFGSRTITAVYSGDQTTFATSTSNAITQQVQQTDMLTTNTVLSASPSTSYFCQSITLSAVVTATQGFYTPTGTVTFFDGDTAIGNGILDHIGLASISVSSLSVGIHTLTATYNSDSNYAFSFSNPINQTVVANPTTTTLSLIPNLSATSYGQTLTFVVVVQAANAIPSGVIILADENGEIATLDIDSTGTATYSTAILSAGIHTYTATYDPACCATPTACFMASSNTLNHTITPVDSNLSLTATPSPAVYGNTINLQANVASYSLGTPTGNVTFYNGSTFLGTAPIIQGIATIEIQDLPAGVIIFNATYNGDTNFIAKNFPSKLELINKSPVSISLVSFSPNPSEYGELIALNATVSSLISIPTGTVTFFSGTTNLGQVTLNGSGVATLETSALSIGTNVLSAVYSGSTNFLTSTSTNLNQVVTQSATQTIIISSPANPSTFNSPVTVNVSVTALNPGNGIPTGNITGFYGSETLGTATLNNGVASFVTTILPAGTPTITAVYSGDTNFISSQGLATHTVNTAATTIATITSSHNASVFGQSVTFSTNVSSTAGIPGGTISFFDGTVQLGIATLDSSGNAAITISSLAIGTHPINVKYSGNSNFTASTSANLNQVVNKASTAITLNSSMNPSVFGEAVTFNAAVSILSPGAGTLSGTITFKNGSVTLGTVNLSGSSTASFSTASLPASTNAYSITASYSGDSNFNASTSVVLNQNVIPVSTLTSAISSPNPSNIDQLVTLTVTVTPINTGIIVPSGVVTASYGSTIIGTGTLNPNGTIIFLTSTLPVGTLPILINYAGNSNFSSSSTTLIQTVSQASSSTTLVSSLNPSHVGELVTLTTTVTSSLGTPSGTVSFFDGSSLLGIQALNGGGIATLAISNLTLGGHDLIAVYNGDTSFATSTSAILSQNVISGITSTTLTSSLNPSAFGQSTILAANINITTGSGTLTGTMTFKDGITVLGTASVVGGGATLSLSNLSLGAHNLTALYSGDANFSSSTSPILIQNVVQATSSTTLSSSTNPTTFGQATLLTANLTVITGGGSPSGTVTFKNGSTVIGTGNVNNGQATLSISSLGIGANVSYSSL